VLPGDGAVAVSETTSIADLKPDDKNARAHTPRNVGMIVDALHEVGAARSIVIDEDDVILAGNATIEAAGLAGIEKVKVIEADGETIIAVRRKGLTAEQKRRLSYFDNRTAELAGWDAEQLLADLGAGVDLSGLFTDLELEDILGDALAEMETGEAPEPQVDKGAELAEHYGVEVGQVWQLGEHRLAVGDCTDKAVVDAVMRGEKAANIVTDPPFNVGFDYKTGFDDKKDLDEYGQWLWMAIELWESQLEEPWRIFIWQAILTCRHWAKWIPRDFRIFASIKDFVQFRPTAIQYSWDPILIWDMGKSSIEPVAGRRDYFISQTSRFVLEENRGHPCPRPIDVVEYIVSELCESGPIIDMFVGSGTTMAACQRLGRCAFACEINPSFAAICIQRLVDMGLEPKLLQ
jgi:DNA modification methylase